MSEKDIKHIDIKEFRELGYLQEVNRCFLHPLGLALEVMVDDDGNERLGGVWDSRDDKEGFHFGLNDPKFTTEEKIQSFRRKSEFINDEYSKRTEIRSNILRYTCNGIESIPIRNGNNEKDTTEQKIKTS